jgi:uncharacterized protein YkwD
MRPITSRRLRRLVVPALAACGLATTAATPASAASPCASGATAVNATTLCLLNAERTARGLRPLRLDPCLSRAALRHSRDMIANRYFAHESRSGAGFSARIARTGWMSGRSGWSVGENIAWGSGNQASPRAIVAEWMHSAGHRRNILQARFHVIGIGVGSGSPVGGGAGATYTTDFGS